MRINNYLYFAGALLLLGSVFVLGIALGSVQISFAIVLHVLAEKLLPSGWIDTHHITEAQEVIVWLIRTPRILTAMLVGSALAIAGAQMQSFLQNPLASPDIMGTSAGGALGAVIALVSGLATQSIFYLPLFAFIGTFSALGIIYTLAAHHQHNPATLLLAGVALSMLLSAIISFLITVTWTDNAVGREIMFWLLGSLNSRTWVHVGIALPCVVVGSSVALFYYRELDILLMGQETAYTLGVEVSRVGQIILLNVALLTATAVAVSGIIGFVGLIIPHIVRLFIGPRHRYLIPMSALGGAIFLVIVDVLARTLYQPVEIQLGIVTAMVGAPFFLYLLIKREIN